MELALSAYAKSLTPCYEKFQQWRRNDSNKQKSCKLLSVDSFPQKQKAETKNKFGSFSSILVDAVRVLGTQNPCLSAKELNPFYDCFPKSPRTHIYVDYEDEEEDDDFGYLPHLPESNPFPKQLEALDQHVIHIRPSDESEAEDMFLTWECEFLEYLDELKIDRREFIQTLNEVVLPNSRHPKVDDLLHKWCLNEGLSEVDGAKLLYHMVGKKHFFNLKECQENFHQVAENHVEIQEAIFSQIEKANIKHRACYDEIENITFSFCENTITPRSLNEFKSGLDLVLQKWQIDWYTVEKLFGSLHSLIQVGPHESILAAYHGETDGDLEFGQLDSISKYPRDGTLLCKSHWGNVHRLQGFNQNLIVKVISLNKWECKKSGFDSWNDDVALEIETHRILSNLNHPNVVRFEGVTQDVFNIYYYQEAGTELFGSVEKHRDRFWEQWKKTLARNERNFFLNNKSPWELRATQIFRGIFEGVKLMHNHGICHRDLKLENMVCVGTNGSLVGKLIDFGVTTRFGEWEKGFRSKGRVGTYPFMSPEMAFNSRDHLAKINKLCIADYSSYDASKNDVWLLGHALWGYATGVLLWSEISSNDTRFTVATRAQFHIDPLSWIKKRKGLRYLARRYGPERNEMMTDELVDLLEKIFTVEKKRLSIDQCLEHTWFQTSALDQPSSNAITSVPLSPTTTPLSQNV